MIPHDNDSATSRDVMPAPAGQPGAGDGALAAVAPERFGMTAAADPFLRGPAGPALNGLALWRAFCSRWFLAVTVGLVLAAAAATIAWFARPAQYTAFALLRVASIEPRLLPPEGAGGETANETYQRTQSALIKSGPVIHTTLRQDKVRAMPIIQEQHDPSTWLDEQLKVGFLEGTEILRVAMTGDNPSDLATLVNAVTEAYLEEVVNAQRNLRLARLGELDRAIAASEDRIRVDREMLKRLAQTLKTTDSQALTAKQRAAQEHFADARRELTRLESELRRAEVELVVQKTRMKTIDSIISDTMIDEAVDTDPVLQKQFLEMNRAEYQLGYTKQLLDKSRMQLRPIVAERLRKRMRSAAEIQIEQIQQRVEILKQQHEGVRAEADRLGKEAEQVGTDSLDLELKRKNIAQTEGLIKTLREQRDRLQVEVQSSTQRVTLLQPADIPETKNIRAQVMRTTLCGTAALFLGVFGVTFWEFRTRRITTAAEVAHELDLRVVGTLPALPARSTTQRARGSRTDDAYWQHLFTESIDGIRTIVVRDGQTTPVQLLMVTSAVGSEGKTMLAGPLASSLARTGRRVLLIDGDLRHPSLHHHFELPDAPGLSEVLRGEMEVEAAVQHLPTRGLAVLPGGRSDRQAIRALGQDGFRKLLEKLRAEYDFVIVDSAPLLPVADSLLIGQHVDAVILSIRPQVSRHPHVHAAYERLRAARIPVLGTVVNGVRDKLYSYKYQYQTQIPS